MTFLHPWRPSLDVLHHEAIIVRWFNRRTYLYDAYRRPWGVIYTCDTSLCTRPTHHNISAFPTAAIVSSYTVRDAIKREPQVDLRTAQSNKTEKSSAEHTQVHNLDPVVEGRTYWKKQWQKFTAMKSKEQNDTIHSHVERHWTLLYQANCLCLDGNSNPSNSSCWDIIPFARMFFGVVFWPYANHWCVQIYTSYTHHKNICHIKLGLHV